jgi:hypothetical protein
MRGGVLMIGSGSGGGSVGEEGSSVLGVEESERKEERDVLGVWYVGDVEAGVVVGKCVVAYTDLGGGILPDKAADAKKARRGAIKPRDKNLEFYRDNNSNTYRFSNVPTPISVLPTRPFAWRLLITIHTRRPRAPASRNHHLLILILIRLGVGVRVRICRKCH